MSEVAMKPDGVRFVEEDSFACSAAIDRSRKALAFSLFSSYILLEIDAWMGLEDEGHTIRRVTSGVGGEIGVDRGSRRGGGVDCCSILIS
jgi:hypothetical protein